MMIKNNELYFPSVKQKKGPHFLDVVLWILNSCDGIKLKRWAMFSSMQTYFDYLTHSCWSSLYGSYFYTSKVYLPWDYGVGSKSIKLPRTRPLAPNWIKMEFESIMVDFKNLLFQFWILLKKICFRGHISTLLTFLPYHERWSWGCLLQVSTVFFYIFFPQLVWVTNEFLVFFSFGNTFFVLVIVIWELEHSVIHARAIWNKYWANLKESWVLVLWLFFWEKKIVYLDGCHIVLWIPLKIEEGLTILILLFKLFQTKSMEKWNETNPNASIWFIKTKLFIFYV
jgi:hypothetical protein